MIIEVDRIIRHGGKLIVGDEYSTIREVENLLKPLHCNVNLYVFIRIKKNYSAPRSKLGGPTHM